MITKKRSKLLTQVERKIISILNRNSCKDLTLTLKGGRKGVKIGKISLPPFIFHLLVSSNSCKDLILALKGDRKGVNIGKMGLPPFIFSL